MIVQKKCGLNLKNGGNNMANIAITTNCNLRCKYCFADEFVGDRVGEEMSFENYLIAKKFILKSNHNGFGLIGGEPSIHSQYRKILQDCIHDRFIKKVTIYTNGLKIKDYIGEYACSKFSFLVNCNSPEEIGETKYRLLEENLCLLANEYNAKNRITLGINLFSVTQNYDFIIDLCKRIGKQEVRVSITIPSHTDDMNDYFAQMKPLLIDFYTALCKNGIQPRYDCNIMPSCIYTEEELFEVATMLSNCGKNRERLIGEKCMCRPVIDILPDLTAIRCFGMSDVCKVNISDFRSLSDLSNFFLREIDFRLANKLKGNECDTCYKRKTLQCSGGCLHFRKKYLMEGGE